MSRFGQGFIYSEELGLLNLNQYAEDNNIDTMGAVLSLPLAISQDGSTIVGLGQSASGGFTSFILKIQPTMGVNDEVLSNLSLSPNPVVENLSIKNSEEINNIVIYTVTGQEILNVNPNQLATTLNLENLNAGVYFAKITSGGNTATKKIIKQ